MTRTELRLAGELDAAATDVFTAAISGARTRALPVTIDCRGLTFVDSRGVRLLIEATDDVGRARLTHVPPVVARTFSLLGLDTFLASQIRHSVAVTICENSGAVDAGRLGEIFLNANEEGCSYEVVSVSARDRDLSDRAPITRWHALVIPPLSRWLGISPGSAHAQWITGLVQSCDHVIAIGTGAFLLAASGCLDGHDVVAGPDYANELAAIVPGARVHCGISALRDGRICTAIAGSPAESLCGALIADDYGVDIQHRLTARWAGRTFSHQFHGSWQ